MGAAMKKRKAIVCGLEINAADFEQTLPLTVEHFMNAARIFGLNPVIWSDHHEENWRVFTAVQQRPR